MQAQALDSLCQTIMLMAEQQTNPVLQVLQDQSPILQDVKYPKDLLTFNHSDWRAYYHCHSNKKDIQHLFSAEHGHFHIFVPVTSKADTWSHLVALSIDAIGQPLRWFMVNHWVCGETWLSADELIKHMQHIPFSEQTNTLEVWLMSMLAIYKEDVIELLKQRDRIINNHTTDTFMNNKAFYLLAEKAINLPEKLQKTILN